MKRSTIRKLEVLEKTQGRLEAEERSSLRVARFYIWTIVLAYYLGGLQLENDDPLEASARALGYSSAAHCRKCIEGQIESDTYVDSYKKISVEGAVDYGNRVREAERRLF